jgi:hypothetical protein
MVNYQVAYELALKLEGTSAKDHFGGIAVRSKKKNFATFWEAKNEVNVLLPPEIQEEIVESSKAFQKIPNAWGKQGWTTVSLKLVDKKTLTWALETAYQESLKRK